MDVGFIALHEHLSTNKYQGRKWNFDEVIDTAKRKVGEDCVLVVSGFADDRLISDRRYETFVDLSTKKYSKRNLDGRATLVQGRDTNVLVVNGLEAEFGEGLDSGSVLVFGLERDKGLGAGRAVNHDLLLAQIPKDAFSAYVHPFHHGGSGPFLEQALKEGKADDYLNPVDGFEVFNAQACLPVPGHLHANKKAFRFFKEAEITSYGLFPFKGSDGHSLMELGNSSTELYLPIKLSELNSWKDAHHELSVRFKYMGEDQNYYSLRTSFGERMSGVVGAARHAFALTICRSLGIPEKVDW